MRIARTVLAASLLLAGVARVEAQLQSSNPPEQAWMQGDTLPDVAEASDLLGGPLSGVPGVPMATGDFNGDTIKDLALGVPWEDVPSGAGSTGDAGIVHVVYGKSGGLDPTTAQTLRQGTGGLAGSAEQGDHFGAALASADFDADGVDDLAIGVPGQLVGFPLWLAGAVHIVYGEKGPGLGGARDHVLYQGLFPNSDQAEAYDNFGATLAVGDFNGDLVQDLAAGAPYEDIAGYSNAGLVVVYLARAQQGLTSPVCQVLTQDQIPGGVSEGNDRFGWALAGGDFDGDGRHDLAIGTPYEDVGSVPDAGLVSVVYGDSLGLDPNRYQTFNQQTLGEVFEAGDALGWALAVGDFNGNGVADLAVGAPYENLGSISDCGIVHTLYGYAQTGLDPGGWLSQDSYLMADANETADQFASALAAGDFDGDGNDDLAIGVAGESSLSGAVSVVHGSLFGLHTQGNQWWTQWSPNVDSYPEPGDAFGASLTAGDFDGNGAADLTIGVPQEDGGPGQTNCGIAHTLYGL